MDILILSLVAGLIAAGGLWVASRDTKPTANEPGDHVARTVLRCTAELLEIPVHTIRSDSKLMADLGADSLDLVELVMYIEDELRIEVSDEQAERVVTVQDAIDLARTTVG